jgi:hypothetical protein
MYMSILGATLLASVYVMQQQQVNVLASSGFEGLGRDVDNALAENQRGSKDGEEQGEDDYPNYNPECPGEPLSAYCLGWGGGYSRGWNAAKTTAD